jgi:hypothetical protein
MKKLVVVLFASTAIGSPVLADEMLKFRATSHVTDSKTLPAPDAPGHTLNIGTYEGMATFPNGSGPMSLTFATDLINGSGAATAAYWSITTPDGSVLRIKSQGTVKVDGQKAVVNQTATVLGGTGKYADAKGEGTITATRNTAYLVNGAETVTDFAIKVSCTTPAC